MVRRGDTGPAGALPRVRAAVDREHLVGDVGVGDDGRARSATFVRSPETSDGHATMQVAGIAGSMPVSAISAGAMALDRDATRAQAAGEVMRQPVEACLGRRVCARRARR